jgi:general secretion pathway protein G
VKCGKTTRLLVDVIVVGVLLVIVAAIVTPQFGPCGMSESKLSNLMSNLQSIRAQLELYRMHHHDRYPADITEGLTRKTDCKGTVSAAGACGPYLEEFPGNPFVGDPAQAVKTTGATGEGWSYDSATGVILANTPNHEGL